VADEEDLWIVKGNGAAGQLVDMPEVVLVTKGDEVPRAAFSGTHEVLAKADARSVSMDTDWKRHLGCKLLEDGEGVVC
jgi:hypothetical protein